MKNAQLLILLMIIALVIYALNQPALLPPKKPSVQLVLPSNQPLMPVKSPALKPLSNPKIPAHKPSTLDTS
jgi:hypothetical protein